jgi:hypothetical protein
MRAIVTLNYGWKVPKCLSCGNTESFNIVETLSKVAQYDSEGRIESSRLEHTDDVRGVNCYECESIEIEGSF